jgi:predicted dehydrogenase
MIKIVPITAVVVGAGHRAMLYASYAKLHPDRLRIVGVVEPDPVRRSKAAELYTVPVSACFASVDQLITSPKIADSVINGTMDDLHVKTTIPLLEAGYHVLLEKPIGVNMKEILELQEVAHRFNRIVMICHVLRYAPFYAAVRKVIEQGEIGKIINVQTAEHVSYHHTAVSFIRGKWNNEKNCGSPMLIQKCCHDLDIIAWMMGGARPVKVASFGSLMQFKPEFAPEGAGKRCLVDCQIEDSCAYSARKNYLDQGLWGFYVWNNEYLGASLTEEEKWIHLRDTSPYGRCVWHCDNDVVDHQSVIMEFEGGATASHNMIGATARPCRTLYIVGSQGEIQGTLEDGHFVIRKPDPRKGKSFTEKEITIDVTDDSHGGGDLLLVEDFVRVLQGSQPSISYTVLDESIYGHVIGFAAEKSRKQQQVESI